MASPGVHDRKMNGMTQKSAFQHDTTVSDERELAKLDLNIGVFDWL